jgi:hypothetical protein
VRSRIDFAVVGSSFKRGYVHRQSLFRSPTSTNRAGKLENADHDALKAAALARQIIALRNRRLVAWEGSDPA